MPWHFMDVVAQIKWYLEAAIQYFWVLPIRLQLPFRTAIGSFVRNKGRSSKRAAHIAAMRYLFGESNPWDVPTLMSFFGKTDTGVYEAWAQANKMEIRTDHLAEGAKLHWVGPRRTDRVLLYFHGGGFVMPARGSFYTMLQAFRTDVERNGTEIGVALVEYSLAPGAAVPTQLRQANAALKHILSHGTDPKNIIWGGDSVGGGLILQLFSHILHPLASIPPPPKISGPFGGALLMSPWTSYSTSFPSYQYNDKEDIFPTKGYAWLAAQLAPGITPENRSHVEPLAADAKTWWVGLDSVVQRIMVLAGGKEAVLDSILQMTDVLKKHVKDTVLITEPNGIHMDIIMSFEAEPEEAPNDADYKAAISFMSSVYKASQ